MQRTILAAMICAVLACADAGAQSSSGTDASRQARDLEEILREAGRQETVSGEMVGLIGSFRKLVTDLESNGVYVEGSGKLLDEMSETIDSTDREHVRVAADELRKAGADLGESEPHVAIAGTEVQETIVRLEALLRRVNALRAGEAIFRELEKIIRDQEKIIDESMKTGRELLEGKTDVSRPPEDLSRDQEKIARHTSDLATTLRQALEDKTDSRALKDAAAFMDKERIDARQQVASQNLEHKDMMAAVTEQKEALRALKALSSKLNDAIREDRNLADAIRDLAREQKDLRMKTESAPTDRFPALAPELKLAQNDLMKRLDEMMRDSMAKAPDKSVPSSPNKAPGQDPKNQAGKPAPGAAKKGGESKGGKGSANNGVGEAAENAPPPSRPGTMPGSPPGKKPGAGPAMQEAMDALGQPNQPTAVQAMTAAEQALGELANIMAGQGQQGDSKPGQQPGKPGQTPGKPGQTPGQPAQNQKPGGKSPGKDGPRQFAKASVYGDRPGEEGSEWSALSRRDRDALSENFARELPREYRDLLKAYYETLARQ